MTDTDLISPLRRVRDPKIIRGRIEAVAAARFDLIAPQNILTLSGDCSQFQLNLSEPLITDNGVIKGPVEASYTEGAWRHVAERLRVPTQYLTRLANDERQSLNWLAASNVNTLAEIDDRTALYRFLDTEDGLILRAVRSDKFLTLDGDAALVAIVKGLMAHGLNIGDCEMEADITVDTLRMKIAVPKVGVVAKELLRDYRSPFDKRPGNELPMLWAGVEITNSDTGNGAFRVGPRAVIQVCNNGLTQAVEFRRTHIGAQLEEGVVQWSDQTVSTALALITSQVEDAVGTFISTEYLEKLVATMMIAKGLDVGSPSDAVTVVQRRFKFSDEETKSVLDCFMLSGDTSVFGLSQAVTAAAQAAETGDRQSEMEGAFELMMAAPQEYVAV